MKQAFEFSIALVLFVTLLPLFLIYKLMGRIFSSRLAAVESEVIILNNDPVAEPTAESNVRYEPPQPFVGIPVYFHSNEDSPSPVIRAAAEQPLLVITTHKEHSFDSFLAISAQGAINRPEVALDNTNDFLDSLEEPGKFEEFLKVYFKPTGWQPEYYASSAMLKITLAILARCSKEYSDKQLRKILHYYSLCFSVPELRLIRNHIQNFMANCDPEHSPLLLTYLTKRLDKFEFYLDLGYDIEVPYITVHRANPLTEEGESQIQNYFAKDKYEGRLLREVVEIEHPELLKKAIPA